MQPSAHRPTTRVLEIFQLLSNELGGLTLTQISARLSIPKGSLSPILRTLSAQQFIQVDALGCYRIGIACYSTGSAFIANMDPNEELRLPIKQAAALCRETIHFAVLDGSDVVYVLKEDSCEVIRMVSSIGKRLSAHCTAVGKALLSGFDDDTVQKLYPNGLPPITENSITDLSVLCKQLADVRQGGFATETEESSLNITCWALPLSRGGKVVASISVSVPLFRADEEKIKQAKSILLDLKQQLEIVLQYNNHLLMSP